MERCLEVVVADDAEASGRVLGQRPRSASTSLTHNPWGWRRGRRPVFIGTGTGAGTTTGGGGGARGTWTTRSRSCTPTTCGQNRRPPLPSLQENRSASGSTETRSPGIPPLFLATATSVNLGMATAFASGNSKDTYFGERTSNPRRTLHASPASPHRAAPADDDRGAPASAQHPSPGAVHPSPLAANPSPAPTAPTC